MIQPDLEDALVRAAADLRSLQVRWALIGGLAVSIRVSPRHTQDVDLIVAVAGDSESETIARTLFHRGYRQLEGGMLHQRGGDRLVGMRFLAPGMDEGIVDLLFHFSGIEREVVEAAELLEIRPRTWAPVARIGHLIALKVLAASDNETRPHDASDLQQLLRLADSGELARARESVELIVRRGFEPPGCDLVAALGRWEREFR